MEHDEIVAEIQQRAAERRLLSHYCPDSRRCRGDRGFPDVVVVGPYGVLFLEVKAGRKGLRPDQTTWTHTLLGAGELALMVREEDLAEGGDFNALLDRLQNE